MHNSLILAVIPYTILSEIRITSLISQYTLQNSIIISEDTAIAIINNYPQFNTTVTFEIYIFMSIHKYYCILKTHV